MKPAPETARFNVQIFCAPPPPYTSELTTPPPLEVELVCVQLSLSCSLLSRLPNWGANASLRGVGICSLAFLPPQLGWFVLSQLLCYASLHSTRAAAGLQSQRRARTPPDFVRSSTHTHCPPPQGLVTQVTEQMLEALTANGLLFIQESISDLHVLSPDARALHHRQKKVSYPHSQKMLWEN